MTINRRILTVGLATAATALSGTAALAQSGDDAVRNADLVALSGGGLLHYEIDGDARTQSVTIAGRRAQKVRAMADEGEGAYHALMNGKRLRTGGTYAVVVRVKVDGKTVVYRDRLVVHRRHARAS